MKTDEETKTLTNITALPGVEILGLSEHSPVTLDDPLADLLNEFEDLEDDEELSFASGGAFDLRERASALEEEGSEYLDEQIKLLAECEERMAYLLEEIRLYVLG